jgi:hypothetical protein
MASPLIPTLKFYNQGALKKIMKKDVEYLDEFSNSATEKKSQKSKNSSFKRKSFMLNLSPKMTVYASPLIKKQNYLSPDTIRCFAHKSKKKTKFLSDKREYLKEESKNLEVSYNSTLPTRFTPFRESKAESISSDIFEVSSPKNKEIKHSFKLKLNLNENHQTGYQRRRGKKILVICILIDERQK